MITKRVYKDPSFEFFNDSGSIPLSKESYIPRSADKELYQTLKRGEICNVLTSRQMGKTSLHLRIAQRLEKEGYTCIQIDLSMRQTGQITPEKWYNALITDILKDLSFDFDQKAWEHKHLKLSPVYGFALFLEEILLKEIPGNIILFLDEIDSLFDIDKNHFSVDDFFALIRGVYQKRASQPEFNRLNFVIIGVAAPSDLISTSSRTPFNIGKSIALNNFTLEEAALLKDGLEHIKTDHQKLLESIYDWTSGQPVLTQKLCSSIAEDEEVIETPSITVAQYVKDLFLNTQKSDSDPHFINIRRRMTENKAYSLNMLILYQRIFCGEEIKEDNTNPVHLYLKLTGIVRSKNGKFVVGNRIYENKYDEDWANEYLIDIVRPFDQQLQIWISRKRSEDALLNGAALQKALEWSQNREDLSIEETEFLSASTEYELNKVKVLEKKSKHLEMERLRLEKKSGKLILFRDILALLASFIVIILLGSTWIALKDVDEAKNEVIIANEKATAATNEARKAEEAKASLLAEKNKIIEENKKLKGDSIRLMTDNSRLRLDKTKLEQQKNTILKEFAYKYDSLINDVERNNSDLSGLVENSLFGKDSTKLNSSINPLSKALAEGNAEEAIDLLDTLIQQDPRNPQNYALLGQIYQAAEEMNKAEDAYNKAVNLSSGNQKSEYLLKRASFYEENDEEEKAEEDFKEALVSADNPTKAIVYQERSVFYIGQTEFKKASEDRVRAIEFAAPAEKAESYFELARFYDDLSEILIKPEAKKSLSDDMITTGAIESFGVNSIAPLLDSFAILVEKNYDLAIQTAINTGLSPSIYYLRKGEWYQEIKKDSLQAIEEFTKAADTAGDIEEKQLALLRRANLYQMREENQKALSDFDTLITLASGKDLGDYYQLRGAFYLQTKELDKAEADLSNARPYITKADEDDYFLLLANLFELKGNLSKAAAFYDTLIVINKELVDIEVALILRKAEMYRKAKDYKNAISNYQEGLKFDFEEDVSLTFKSEFLEPLAESYKQQGRLDQLSNLPYKTSYDNALAIYDTLLKEAYFKQGFAFYQQGVIYELRGDNKKAEEAYRKAIDNLDSDSDFHLPVKAMLHARLSNSRMGIITNSDEKKAKEFYAETQKKLKSGKIEDSIGEYYLFLAMTDTFIGKDPKKAFFKNLEEAQKHQSDFKEILAWIDIDTPIFEKFKEDPKFKNILKQMSTQNND